jgi:hypothetical protein
LSRTSGIVKFHIKISGISPIPSAGVVAGAPCADVARGGVSFGCGCPMPGAPCAGFARGLHVGVYRLNKDALPPKPHAPAWSQILAGSLERLRNNRCDLHGKTRTHEPAQRPLSGPRREIAEPKNSHRGARPCKLRLARPDFLVLLLANFISGSVSAVPYRPGAGIGRTRITGSGARPAGARPAIGGSRHWNGCRCIRSRRRRSSHRSFP